MFFSRPYVIRMKKGLNFGVERFFPIREMVLLFIMLFFSLFLDAQQGHYFSSDKKAIKLYEEAFRAYNGRMDEQAEALLLKTVNKDPRFLEAWELLSRVQFELGENDKAIQSLYKAVEISAGYHPENFFYLGMFEFNRGEYGKAKENIEQYLASSDSDKYRREKAGQLLASCEFAIGAIENPVPFEPVNLGPNINSENPEYLPCLTADDALMLFTRRVKDREAPSGMQDDLFYSVKDREDNWKPAKGLSGINTVFNEGAASISADGSTLVFTACEYYGSYGKNRQGFGSCDLFIATRTTDGWSNPENMGDSINSGNWESQPSLSIDGRTLYFIRAPKRKNKETNQDIYVATRNDDGTWNKARKLPDVVNTPGREETVLIHPDGVTLYFSSNGFPGMGGLDLFMTRKDSAGNWMHPANLGYPINTGKDENSLMVSASGKLAYFSSNKEGGYGSFDIYGFELYPEARPLPVTYVKGTVYDSLTRNPVKARFQLIDLASDEKIYDSYADPANGGFLIPLPAGKNYALIVNHPGYLFFSGHFSLDMDSREPYRMNVPLVPIAKGGEVVLNNVFFDTDKYDLKPESRIELNKLVELLENNPTLQIAIEGHTDSEGDENHNRELSENRARSVFNYLIEKGINASRLSYKGYGESRPVADNSTPEGRAKNRRTSFRVTSL